MEVSRFHYLSDEEILDCVQAKAKLQRGFRFDEKTMFLVLTIPAGSPHHNAEAMNALRKRMNQQLQVAPRHYQIDEDWYIYIYLSTVAPADLLSEKLASWCKSQGFELGKDCLEVHPSSQPLPIPLQDKFAWLNEKCQLLVRRTELSTEDALGFFLEDAGKNSVDPAQLIEKLDRIVIEHGELAQKEKKKKGKKTVEATSEQEPVLDFNPASTDEQLGREQFEPSAELWDADASVEGIASNEQVQSKHLQEEPHPATGELAAGEGDFSPVFDASPDSEILMSLPPNDTSSQLLLFTTNNSSPDNSSSAQAS